MKEFVKWIWGVAGARPPAGLIGLYQRACVCRMFPAYRLDELKDLPAAEILRAMELLDTAQKAMTKA